MVRDMKKRLRSLRCPTCRAIVLRTDPEFPFCSERCRLIDLGKWASGAYVVSSPLAEMEKFTPESRQDGSDDES
jgi:hypothetical protein